MSAAVLMIAATDRLSANRPCPSSNADTHRHPHTPPSLPPTHNRHRPPSAIPLLFLRQRNVPSGRRRRRCVSSREQHRRPNPHRQERRPSLRHELRYRLRRLHGPAAHHHRALAPPRLLHWDFPVCHWHPPSGQRDEPHVAACHFGLPVGRCRHHWRARAAPCPRSCGAALSFVSYHRTRKTSESGVLLP